MATTIRQNILTAYNNRLLTILTTGGYNTNLGQQIHYDLATPLNESQTPALRYKIKDDIVDYRYGAEVHRLVIDNEISAVGSSADTTVESCIGDFMAALAADGTLGGVCQDISNFVVNEAIIDHQGTFSVQVPVTVEIWFSTKINDPYTAV